MDRKIWLQIWRRVEPLNRVDNVRITGYGWVCVELYGIPGADGRQVRFWPKNHILGPNSLDALVVPADALV